VELVLEGAASVVLGRPKGDLANPALWRANKDFKYSSASRVHSEWWLGEWKPLPKTETGAPSKQHIVCGVESRMDGLGGGSTPPQADA
jgi:hypothetical protein